MKLEKFTVKDIIFIAIMSAALVLAGSLTMPFVMNVELFGVRNLTSALMYSILTIIALMKVKKIGTLTLLGFFHGCVLLMMAPVMFFNMVVGSIGAELLTFLIFRNYNTEKAQVFATTMFIPFTIPTTLIFTMLLNGKTFEEVINKPVISLFLCIGTVVLSYISTKLGQKIGKELQKAGKL